MTDDALNKEIIEHEGEDDLNNILVAIGVTDKALTDLGSKYKDMPADNPAEYKALVAGIREVRTLRTTVDKTRLTLKREIDKESKRIVAVLIGLEDPMKATKEAYDEVKAAEKAERDRLEKIRVDGIKALITKRFGLQRIEHLQAESSTLIRCRIAAIEGGSIGEDEFHEFVEDATEAKLILIETANTILVNRIQFEIDEKERKEKEAKLEADRVKLEADRKTFEEEKRQAEPAQASEPEESAEPAEPAPVSEASAQDRLDGPGIDVQVGLTSTKEQETQEKPKASTGRRVRRAKPEKEVTELTKLLAAAIGVDLCDFNAEAEAIILTIGKGIHWSSEFHMIAKNLAADIDEELTNTANTGDQE